MADSPIPWTATTEAFDQLWSGDTDADIDPATDKVPDMLATIFTQQRALMRAVWTKEINSGLSVPTSFAEWGELDSRALQARIHESFGYLIRELAEAMQHLDGSKSWKLNPRPVDADQFREEMADALHFFAEMCVLAGIDEESLFALYFAKSATNFHRVENNF